MSCLLTMINFSESGDSSALSSKDSKKMGNHFSSMKKYPRVEQLIGKNEPKFKDELTGDHPRSEKGSQAWLRKASWLVQWKGLGSGCYYKHRSIIMVKLLFFHHLEDWDQTAYLWVLLVYKSISESLVLVLFLRLKKDHCWFQRDYFKLFYSDPWEIRFLNISIRFVPSWPFIPQQHL